MTALLNRCIVLVKHALERKKALVLTLSDLQQQLVDALWHSTPAFVAASVIFTALALIPGQVCNSGLPWWRNPELITDCYYMVFGAIAGRYLATVMVTAFVIIMVFVLPSSSLFHLLTEGGPLRRAPFFGQFLLYVILSDFLLYWIHRVFHKRILWPFHAIHHAAENVDWTTAYRIHPINLMFSVYLVAPLMFYLGVPADVLVLVAPFDTAYSYFVHANLNWSLGPLKYILASPLFHRWHHTRHDGGNCNFAPTFAVWDVLFGTFYMPVGQLPIRYGIVDESVPHGFLPQIFYPFRELAKSAKVALFAGPRFRS